MKKIYILLLVDIIQIQLFQIMLNNIPDVIILSFANYII